MPPETPPTTSPTPQAGLDPSVVALTKALGKTESGGKYNAPSGDPGSAPSAYQFTPDFINNYAPKILGSGYDAKNLTPAQQDQLAYGVVKEWGTTGDPSYPHLGKLNPAQIASAWNAGDPNAYLDPNYGKNNAYGSVANYVNKVGENYNANMPGQNTASASSSLVPTANAASGPTNSSSSSQPSWLSALEGIGGAGLAYLAGSGASALKSSLPLIGAGVGEAIEPLGGGVIGGLAGEGLSSLIPGAPQSSTSSATPQPQQQNDAEFTQSAQASNSVKDAIMQAMQGTQTGRVFSQSQDGQNSINTAAKYGLIGTDENGAMTFNEEKRQKSLGELANGEKKLVESEGEVGQMAAAVNHAAQYLGRDKTLTPNERKEALQRVREEAQGYAPLNGNIPLGSMVDARHQQYAATRGKYNVGKTTAQISAHKALGHGFRQTIQGATKNPELYNALLKEESNLINAKHVGKKLNGKKAPQNKGIWESFLRQGARAAEIYIGDRLGGPIGAVVAGLVGEHLNRKIEKKFGRNIFETKGMRAALDVLKDTKPKEYTRLMNALEKNGITLNVDTSKVPGTTSGLVKDVKKDEKKIKGLVKPKI